MKFNKLRTIGMFLGAMFLAGSTVSVGAVLIHNANVNSREASATYTNGDASTYYSGISDSATGDTLLTALQSLNSTKRQFTPGYGTSSSGLWNYFDQTDGSGSQYYGFYEGTLMNKSGMNKEHVWPNSRGGGAVEDDIHMVRPTSSADNSSRGNSFYVEGGVNSSSGWDPYAYAQSKSYSWPAAYRGAAARIIFYCTTVSSNLTLVDATTASTVSTTTGSMGKLSDLLKWNLEYPVSEFDSVTHENQRNEAAESIQGNRNAFIDHPEYACKIWGDTNATTQSICAASTTPSLTLDAETKNIASGQTTTLTATTVGSSIGTVSWTTSNSNVCSLSATSGSSVTLTGGSTTGTATITASATIDSASYSDTCSVTVAAGSVSISASTLSLNVGGTNTLYATSSNSGSISWLSSNTGVATVSNSSSSSGSGNTVTITGVAGGTATITASATINSVAYSDVCNVTVIDTSAYTYNLVTNTSNLAAGDTCIIVGSDNASTYFSLTSTATGTSYPWYLTGTSVAPSSGVITQQNLVEWTVGKSDSYYTFTNSSTDLYGYVNSTHYSINYGSTYTISSTTTDVASSYSGVNTWTYTISDSSTGAASLYANSSASVYLSYSSTYSNFSGSSTAPTTGGIYIYKKGTSTSSDSVSLSPTSLSLTIGGTSTITATASGTVTWSSNNESVATVSGGVVTAVAAGNATITATCGTATATCSVTVVASGSSSDSVSLDKSVASTTVSSTVTLTATASGTVTWTTSDSSIATVSGGVVSGVAIGTCIITATVGSASATCEVTVSGTISGGSSDGSYTKVTAAPSDWSGTYLIVYESSDTEGYALNGSTISSNDSIDATNNASSVTISNSTIAYSATVAAYQFTIAQTSTSGTYTIKSDNQSYYIGATGNKSLATSTTATTYTSTLTYSSSGVSIYSNSTAYLCYNTSSGQVRFRFYTTASMGATQLYKYTAGSSGELTDAQKAEQFAVNFNAANVCGTDNNTSAISSIWLEQQTAFTALDLTVQTYLTGVVTSDTTTYSAAVIACVTRYDRVISLYYSSNPTGFPNFMSRSTTSSNEMAAINNNDALVILLLTVTGILTITFGGLSLLRKRKVER